MVATSDARFPSLRPRLGRTFFRAHGLGNDYLVMEETDDPGGWPADPGAVREVCHRGRGEGSDGIVVVLRRREDDAADAPVRLRMFNPDGSEFERSGNGLRIAAAWLLDAGRVAPGEPFAVEVGGGGVEMEVHGRSETGVVDVSVAMGRARVGPDAVALDPAALDREAPGGAHGWLETSETGPLPVHLVSVGNPHCVVFVGALEDGPQVPNCFTRAALERMGPGLETHAGYTHGTNVQLARVPRGGEGGEGGVVEALIWERGVGPTLASGTSACAVAVSAVASGRLEPGPVEVRMEGGSLRVTVSPELDIVLRGPVQEVGRGELAPGYVAGLPRAQVEVGRKAG